MEVEDKLENKSNSSLGGKIPLVTSLILIINLTSFLFSIAFPQSVEFLANIPSETFSSLRIHSLITSCLVTLSFFPWLFSFILFLTFGTKREAQIGSTKLAIEFFGVSLALQILYLPFICLFAIFYHTLLKLPICGVWPYFAFSYSLSCFRQNDRLSNRSLLPLPPIFQPILLILLASIVHLNPAFNVTLAILLAYLISYFKLFELVDVNDSLMKKVNSLSIFKKLETIPGFKHGNLDFKELKDEI